MLGQVKQQILLVEDDDILCQFLRKQLMAQGYGAVCISCGEAIPRILDRDAQHIDLIVLDVLLPGKNGFYWLQWLQQYHAYIPVIMASIKSNEDERLRGLNLGAVDYVIKPFYGRELLIRIQNILGKQLVGYVQERFVINHYEIDVSRRSLCRDDKCTNLTVLETKLLQLFYRNSGYTLTREEIMQQVWGKSYNPHSRNLDICITQLRRKLEDNPSKPRFIRTVRGKGYALYLPAVTS